MRVELGNSALEEHEDATVRYPHEHSRPLLEHSHAELPSDVCVMDNGPLHWVEHEQPRAVQDSEDLALRAHYHVCVAICPLEHRLVPLDPLGFHVQNVELGKLGLLYSPQRRLSGGSAQ